MQAADDGQRLRDEGKLIEARDTFARCLRAECPSVIAKECAAWLDDVAARAPTAIIVMQSASGNDVAAARVLVDGVVRDEAQAGRAITLNPGPHLVRAESPRESAEVSVVLHEREQGRRVVLTLAGPTTSPAVKPAEPELPPRPPETARPVPFLTYPLGAVSLVAAGVGAFFAVSASTQYSDLERHCPACSESDVADLRRTTLIADVALGTAIVAAAGALFVYLTRPSVLVTPRTGALVSF
jgi:hypothetical protein